MPLVVPTACLERQTRLGLDVAHAVPSPLRERSLAGCDPQRYVAQRVSVSRHLAVVWAVSVSIGLSFATPSDRNRSFWCKAWLPREDRLFCPALLLDLERAQKRTCQ